MTAIKSYKGYTLVEMLVVLAIFIIIATIGFSSFYGLKDAITMNEKILTLTQDIRFAQRSALFVDRQPTDRWVYGIGIDFSNFEAEGSYRLFRWCSQFNDYGDVRTKSTIPNFDSSAPINTQNGNLPVGEYSTNCTQGLNTTELVRLPDSGDRLILGFNIDIPSGVRYLLFESVSGRAFFYDSTGSIVNYNPDGSIISSPINFELSVGSDRTGTTKVVTVNNISGKSNVRNENR